MDKSEIKLYNPGEAEQEYDNFKKDWKPVDDFGSMHKTGLKMVRLQDENGRVADVWENKADWMRHMSHDEGLSGREIIIYLNQLSQEFEVLIDHYTEDLKAYVKKVEVLNDVMPYIMENMNKKHKS